MLYKFIYYFIVRYDDIIDWQFKFLKICEKYNSGINIYGFQLLNSLDFDNSFTFRNFPVIWNNLYDIDNIITFICLFALCNRSTIIRILLLCSGCENNEYITLSEALLFFEKLNFSWDSNIDLNEWYEHNKKNTVVKITEVIELVSSTHGLFDVISNLKKAIIKRIIGVNEYGNIIRRCLYHNYCYDTLSPLKSNSCFNKFCGFCKNWDNLKSDYREEGMNYKQINYEFIKSARLRIIEKNKLNNMSHEKSLREYSSIIGLEVSRTFSDRFTCNSNAVLPLT